METFVLLEEILGCEGLLADFTLPLFVVAAFCPVAASVLQMP